MWYIEMHRDASLWIESLKCWIESWGSWGCKPRRETWEKVRETRQSHMAERQGETWESHMAERHEGSTERQERAACRETWEEVTELSSQDLSWFVWIHVGACSSIKMLKSKWFVSGCVWEIPVASSIATIFPFNVLLPCEGLYFLMGKLVWI